MKQLEYQAHSYWYLKVATWEGRWFVLMRNFVPIHNMIRQMCQHPNKQVHYFQITQFIATQIQHLHLLALDSIVLEMETSLEQASKYNRHFSQTKRNFSIYLLPLYRISREWIKSTILLLWVEILNQLYNSINPNRNMQWCLTSPQICLEPSRANWNGEVSFSWTLSIFETMFNAAFEIL